MSPTYIYLQLPIPSILWQFAHLFITDGQYPQIYLSESINQHLQLLTIPSCNNQTNHPHMLPEFRDQMRTIILSIIQSIEQPPLQVSAEHSVLQLIEHTYHPSYNIYQGKCYQQHSMNLCGYHAIFNTFCFLNYLNAPRQCQFKIQSCSSFWKFKIEVQRFLLQIKADQNKPDQWPWKHKDIREGDFERVYYKICLQKFPKFHIFNHHDKFYYLTHTWSFQYSNLLLDSSSRKELSEKFKQLREHKEEKPMVLHLMLGITTHWLTFFAINQLGKITYWFFDSQNDHYLDLNWEQIVEHIEMQNKDNAKYGHPEITAFQKQTYCVCVKDIQLSLKLIINCIENKDTLQSYSYNQKFSVFATPLTKAIELGGDEVSRVVREYEFNITSFFIEQVQWGLLNAQNSKTLKYLIEAMVNLKEQTEQCLFLYELTQMSYSYL